MQRKFIGNLIILLVLNLLIKPYFIFGIDMNIQNRVGVEDYGFYFSLLNFSFLFNILLDVGITNFNNRNIAQHAHLLSKHFSSIAVIRMVLFVIYAVFSITVGLVLDYGPSQFRLLGWLIFNQFLVASILYLRSNVSGLLLFRTDSMLSVLDKALMILICSAMLHTRWFGASFKIEWFVYAQTLAYGLTFLVALLVVSRKSGGVRLRWNIPFYLVILKRSLPFAMLILLMMLYNRIDSVMLERMLPDGKTQAGIYASAYRLLDAVNQFSFLFAVLLLPMFSRMIGQREPVHQLVKLSFTIIIIPAIVMVVLCLFYQHEIMHLLYRQHVNETMAAFEERIRISAQVLGLLMSCYVAVSVTYIFGTLLTANGSLRLLNMVAIGGIVINLALNLALIPAFQIVGSAWASIVTQYLTAGAQLLLAVKLFNMRVNKRFLLELALFILSVVLISFLTKAYVSWPWGLQFFLIIFSAAVVAVVSGLLKLKAAYKAIVRQS